MFTVDREALAWAAGLFEGEGCIRVPTIKGTYKSLVLAVAITDKDVLEKFHSVVGGLGTIYGPYTAESSLGKKPRWKWTAQRFEHSQAILAMFWPWLGERRKQRATEALLAFKEQSKRNTKIRNKGMICSDDSCGSAAYSKTLCKHHYERMMSKKRRDIK